MKRGAAQKSERIAVVERIYELFNQLDLDPETRRASPVTAELLELFDPEVKFTQPATQPEGIQHMRGREALRDSWDDWFEMWVSHRSCPDQMRERGDRVLVLSRERFRGRDGVELEQKAGTLFTFDGSKVVRIQAFFDQETATDEFER